MEVLEPYINFAVRCREAMTFYHECLGGDLLIMTVGESPMADQVPENVRDQVMHSLLRNGNVVLMASDMSDQKVVKGNNSYLTLTCSSQEEQADLFAKLSAGGAIGHELSEQFFGTIGDCIDKFGISWMLVVTNPDTM